MNVWPSNYRAFVGQNDLIGREFTIPPDDDCSGVGASLELFDELNAIDERDHAYPGVIVRNDGYTPVGGCSLGSGDQYFISHNDIEPGPLYRIDHEAVVSSDYCNDTAIAIVLETYDLLLNYQEAPRIGE